jgi:hypothetical protein
VVWAIWAAWRVVRIFGLPLGSKPGVRRISSDSLDHSETKPLGDAHFCPMTEGFVYGEQVMISVRNAVRLRRVSLSLFPQTIRNGRAPASSIPGLGAGCFRISGGHRVFLRSGVRFRSLADQLRDGHGNGPGDGPTGPHDLHRERLVPPLPDAGRQRSGDRHVPQLGRWPGRAPHDRPAAARDFPGGPLRAVAGLHQIRRPHVSQCPADRA